MTGLNYVKIPRDLTGYNLMKGITDFSNLKQFDLFETGYSFLTVVSTPKFMQDLAKKSNKVSRLEEGLIHVMEGEFKGLDGIPDIQADAGEISNGANSMNLINNVTMETNIQISMEFYERSGGLITNYMSYYLTGIKDPYSKAKTYHGLVGTEISDPGPDYEVFTFLYYVTDNTMRRIEKAYLFANAQPITAPTSNMYNSQRGEYNFQTVNLTFNTFPIIGDDVNRFAAMMLQNDLVTESTERKLILDSNDYKFDVYKDKLLSRSGYSKTGEILTSGNVTIDRNNQFANLNDSLTNVVDKNTSDTTNWPLGAEAKTTTS